MGLQLGPPPKNPPHEHMKNKVPFLLKNYPANQFIWVNLPIKNGFIHIRWLFDLFWISASKSMFQMINEKTLVVRVYRG